MKSLIVILNHKSKEDIDFHRDWHSQICDTKVIWQTSEQSTHPDIYSLDIPGKIVIPMKMRIYCHYAAKFEYDYYVFLDGDAFILRKDFIQNVIEYMQNREADVCFTHLSDYQEHYKSIFYDLVRKEYGINNPSWSLNICNIVSAKAIKLYNDNNYYKIYDEVDFANCMSKYCNCVVYPDIDYEVFYAGEIFGKIAEYGKMGRPKDFSKINIIHAVKDYSQLSKLGITLQ